MRVDIDEADFGFVFIRFGSTFIELVDCGYTIVESLSERFAEMWIVVERVDGWDTPILKVAPMIIVGAEELRNTLGPFITSASKFPSGKNVMD